MEGNSNLLYASPHFFFPRSPSTRNQPHSPLAQVPGRTSFGCQFRWRRLAAGLTRDNSNRASLRSSLPLLNNSLRSPQQARTSTTAYEQQHPSSPPSSAATESQ